MRHSAHTFTTFTVQVRTSWYGLHAQHPTSNILLPPPCSYSGRQPRPSPFIKLLHAARPLPPALKHLTHMTQLHPQSGAVRLGDG